MKNALLTLLFSTAVISAVSAAPDSFYVSGNKIYDPCGEQFVPRGINYPVLDDWDFPSNMGTTEQSAEIIKANPNLVRIAWYNDYGQPSRPAFALSDLDSVISRFSRAGIVSVINLMDMTCTDDYATFATRVNGFWTRPDVVALTQKHKGMLMVNIANEFGDVNWAGNPASALVTWKNNYKNTVSAMRTAGIVVPILIDAPDCGTSLDVLLSTGAEFLSSDPIHNTICSVHAYWGLDDSATVAGKVQQIGAAGFPIIMGEVANWQTDANPCQYSLQLTSMLRQAQILNVGWMSWCWYKDHCPLRQLTTNGLYSNLSPYGQVIINDPIWGLATRAIKTYYQTHGGTCNPTGIKNIKQAANTAVDWHQPQHTLTFREAGSFILTNIAGDVVAQQQVAAGGYYITDASLPDGVYVVRFVNSSGQPSFSKIYIGNN